jgi:hypothetical protein
MLARIMHRLTLIVNTNTNITRTRSVAGRWCSGKAQAAQGRAAG